MNNIRQQLVDYRKMKGYTQKSVADAIGVTQTALSRYERGASDMTSTHRDAYCEAIGLELQLVIKE